MRRAVLTVVLSVALVTAAGSFGAAVVGDAARDAGRDAPDPVTDREGVVDAEEDRESDGGRGLGLAPLVILSPGEESVDDGAATAGSDGDPTAGSSTSEDDAPAAGGSGPGTGDVESG